jgi:putative ABC transport system permease protein
MGPVIRGIKNVFRSPLGTGAILVLLTVSIAMALVMIQVRGSIDLRAQEARETIGTAIQVRPLGGTQGASEPLTDADIQSLEGLEHVVAINRSLDARYGGEALEPAVDTSSFGNHGGGTLGVFGNNGASTDRRIPISFSGVSFANGKGLFQDGVATLTSGRVFESDDSSALVAVLGQTLAEVNRLSVGSVFQLENGEPLEVVGIFSAGDQWGDNTVYMPLGTMRQLMGVEDWVGSATVFVDSVDDLELVVADITKTLGEGRVDVTSGLESMERLTEPLEALRSTSSVGLLAALGGSGGVILLAMFALVRERTREIGVLKAIGASWRQILTQFTTEALVISVAAAILAFVLAVASAETVAAEFFDPASQATNSGGFSGQH